MLVHRQDAWSVSPLEILGAVSVDAWHFFAVIKVQSSLEFIFQS